VGNVLNHFFRIHERRSSLRTEVLGGATTFVTMAYIIVVNPAILASGHIPDGPALKPETVATILTAVFGCLLMGLYANRPLAVAPYMGENAFIAFSLGAITWQQRLGSVFVSGLAFLVLTLFGLRRWLAGSISPSMCFSFAVGIGLFLFLVGATQTEIVIHGVAGHDAKLLATNKENGKELIANPSFPPVKLGNVHEPRVLLAVAGFILIATLLYWNVRGGILLGIMGIGAAGYFLGLAAPPEAIWSLPGFDADYNLDQIAFQLDVASVIQISFLPILLTLFLISFLDTLGTLVAVGSAGNMVDARANFPNLHRPMVVDSLSCMFSALVGTSTSGAYIESTAGVREGARTGLAAIVTGLLFAVALFFIPLFAPLQQLRFAYGPALMAVGLLMTGAVAKINFEDLTEAVPALATITMMLFTFNIANGLTAGLALYPVFKVLTGRWRDLNLGSIILSGMCLCYLIFGLIH
jgi:AGZA family xanthine/uracil permease-like MFS transporter